MRPFLTAMLSVALLAGCGSSTPGTGPGGGTSTTTPVPAAVWPLPSAFDIR